MTLERSTVELLRTLVRHRTVNPPGNERALQEELAALLRGAGFAVHLLGRTPQRPNLVAELAGDAPGPTFALISHVDTVDATPADWTHDPWGGELDGGFVWGRGAVDMKSQTAAEVAAVLELAAAGWRPARVRLLVIAVVDEETGSADGARWLCEQHPALVRCDYLINEGAGAPFAHEGRTCFGVCVAEKGVLRCRLTTRGRAAHASTPGLGDNALTTLAGVLQRLGERPAPPLDLSPEAAALVAALGLPAEPAALAAAVDALDPALRAFVAPALRVTICPTVVSGPFGVNVVPGAAEAILDCRVPRHLTEEQALRRIADALGPGPYELEVIQRIGANASPADSPLMDAIGEWLAREAGDAVVVPFVFPAFTDTRVFRDAFPDCVAYGFFPHRHMTLAEAAAQPHAADERIDARDVGWAARCYRELTLRMLG